MSHLALVASTQLFCVMYANNQSDKPLTMRLAFYKLGSVRPTNQSGVTVHFRLCENILISPLARKNKTSENDQSENGSFARLTT